MNHYVGCPISKVVSTLSSHQYDPGWVQCEMVGGPKIGQVDFLKAHSKTTIYQHLGS